VLRLVLEMDGRFYTPPRDAGLLDGVFRQHLLEQGTLTEAALYPEDIDHAERIWLINSVREWIPARITETVEDP